MKLLDACLALALTLALFASAVTVLVELFQRAVLHRVKDLRNMLGLAFDRSLATALGVNAEETAALRMHFIDAVSTRRGTRELVSAGAGLLAKAFPGRLSAVSRIDVDDLLHRLGRDDTFRQRFSTLDVSVLKPALERLVAQFERLEADASALFAARAQRLSFVCGVLLALTVNVDAIRIVNHYVGDPAGTARTIAQLAAVAPGTAQAKNTSVPADEEAQIVAVITELQGLSQVGIPVGASFFPYCTPPGQHQIDPACTGLATDGNAWQQIGANLSDHGIQLALWLLSVVVTGLLIGLGGPFWFDIASALSQVRNLLGSVGGKSRETPTPATATEPPAPTVQERIDAITQLAKPENHASDETP
jgi:hypothetical protein